MRNFTGIFIPSEIYLDERLTLVEKILFVELRISDSIDPEFLGISPEELAQSIVKLRALGLIPKQNSNSDHPVTRHCTDSVQRVQSTESTDSVETKSDDLSGFSSDSSSLSRNSPFNEVNKPKKTRKYSGLVWSSFLDLLQVHGLEKPTAQKMIGKLVKDFGIDFMEAICAQFWNQIKSVDDPYAYFRKLLDIHKNIDPEQLELDNAIREAEFYHNQIYSRTEYVPKFDALKYVDKFPILRKLKW